MNLSPMPTAFAACVRRMSCCCRIVCAVVLVGITAAGCGGGRQDARGIRVAVNGSVTLDGELLPAGRINFITDQGEGKVKATAEIVDGWYTFTDQNGPLEGKARVEVRPMEMELEQFEAARDGDVGKRVDVAQFDIPAEYNIRSKLTATISADAEKNYLNFELVTKTTKK